MEVSRMTNEEKIKNSKDIIDLIQKNDHLQKENNYQNKEKSINLIININDKKNKYINDNNQYDYQQKQSNIVKDKDHELRLAKAKYGINIEDEKEKEKIYNPDEEA